VLETVDLASIGVIFTMCSVVVAGICKLGRSFNNLENTILNIQTNMKTLTSEMRQGKETNIREHQHFREVLQNHHDSIVELKTHVEVLKNVGSKQ